MARPALIVLALLATLLAGTANADTPRGPALVVHTNGSPIHTRAAQRRTLRAGNWVLAGDRVETDAKAKVKILLSDDSILTLGPRSKVELTRFDLDPAGRTVRLKVLVGRFKLAVSKFFGGPSDYEVRTPTAVAGVRGTVLWGDTDLDAICSLEGQIEVRPLSAEKNPASLGAGECAAAMGEGRTDPLAPSAEDLAAYLAEVTLE